MKLRGLRLFVISCGFFSVAISVLGQGKLDERFNSGKILFQTRCSSCHSVHKEIVGPMLASISKKRNESWLISFIQNSQKVITGNDVYAQFLFERYSHQVMPSFRDLPVTDIKEILYYINAESMQPQYDIQSGLAIDQQSNPSVLHGQLLFEIQCAACHYLDHEGSYGPALGSVTKRHSDKWLTAFIKNSTKVIQSGDSYAVALFNNFGRKEMAVMEFLTDDEISDILQYIEFKSSSDHATAGASGRKTQFKKKSSEIHTEAVDKPIEGGSIITVVVVFLLITGFTVYGVTVLKLFRYLQR